MSILLPSIEETMETVEKKDLVRENSGLQLTPEQELIITSTGDIKINAVAGSGKTTTIIHYAASRPREAKILYLAFNRSVRLDAKKKFADKGLHNVQVETAHSLAYRPVVVREGYSVSSSGYKTHEIVEILGLTGGGEKHSEYILANHINKFICYFCNSNVLRVQDLNYIDVVKDEAALKFVRAFYSHIEKGARLFLAKMNNREIDITHDFYLKKFQLSNPVLDYDYILFDEGQDASPAMLDIFLKQKATKVIVGDMHQQIYSWRHAVNSLDKTGFKTYNLSTSFRFNQDIANLATTILGWKNHLQPTNTLSIKGKGTSVSNSQKATLGRTNLGLLIKAISFIKENPRVNHLYFEGNINTYTYAEDGASLYDVLHLYNNKHRLIRDKLIASMKTMADLEDYIKKTEDVQLGMMVEIVREYENEIPHLIWQLKQKHVGDGEKDKAQMIFSTVHRAKGMEYDTVELAEDFVTESRIERIKSEGEAVNIEKSFEEINLLYVALTRAKHLLRLPEAIMPASFPESKFIEVLVKKPEEEIEFDPLEALREKKLRRSKWPDRIAPKDPGRYDEIRLQHKNAYMPWTKESDEELKAMYYNETKLADMAKHFGRKSGAIRSRLKKLGCVQSDHPDEFIE